MVGGGESYRDVAITEVLIDGTDGVTYTYEGAFPTRYDFPTLDVWEEGDLVESSAFKPRLLTID